MPVYDNSCRRSVALVKCTMTIKIWGYTIGLVQIWRICLRNEKYVPEVKNLSQKWKISLYVTYSTLWILAKHRTKAVLINILVLAWKLQPFLGTVLVLGLNQKSGFGCWLASVWFCSKLAGISITVYFPLGLYKVCNNVVGIVAVAFSNCR